MTTGPTWAVPPDSPAAFALECGRSRRIVVPHRSHGGWTPAGDHLSYSIETGGLPPVGMRLYAEVCAWALARAHARSGKPAEIGV